MTVRRTIIGLITMVLVATAALAFSAAPASAQGAILVNIGSGNGCLDLSSYTNGWPAVLARCDRTKASQYWTYANGLLVNVGSVNGCLDLSSYQNGGRAVINRCDETNPSQMWDPETTGTIRNIGSGNGCIQFASYANGTPATLTRCALGDNHQQWGLF